MTEKQVNELEKRLSDKYWGGKMHCCANLKQPVNLVDQILFEKIAIMNMSLAILTYGGHSLDLADSSWWTARRNELESLGVKKASVYMKAIWCNIEKDFKAHATIKWDVGGYSEDGPYNSVKWDDENN